MNQQSCSSLSFDQFQEIISCIYDAALDPDQWNNVIEKMAMAFQAKQGYIRVINSKSSQIQHVYTHNKDPQWEQPYKDYYIHKDPWLNDILKEKKTFVSCTHHHLSNREYEALEFHRDFVLPQKNHYGIGGRISIDDNLESFFGLNRDKIKQGFEDEYLNALQLFVPHIQKALLINEKTRHSNLRQKLLSDALNQINSPLLLLDKNGGILFINSQAEQLIEFRTDISIKNNHIILSSPTDHRNLEKLIHKATGRDNSIQQGGAMCFSDPVTHSAISILVNPISPNMVHLDTQSNKNVLLVLSTHQDQKSLPIELLTDLYNLTPAEARLTASLCRGLTLDEVSEKLELSKNTLKSQLRSCFTKVGVNRQSELIRLINAGPTGIIKTTE